MSDLKSRLVKLARQNPELRAHLVPLLHTAAKEGASSDDVEVGDLIEVDNHRFVVTKKTSDGDIHGVLVRGSPASVKSVKKSDEDFIIDRWVEAEVEVLRSGIKIEGGGKKAATDPALEAMLLEAADLFGSKYAQTRYTMGGPKVKTEGGKTFLQGHLQPYNKARVDSYYVLVSGEQVQVKVHGQIPGDDVESQGFMHVSAEQRFPLKGVTADQLARVMSLLGKKMR